MKKTILSLFVAATVFIACSKNSVTDTGSNGSGNNNGDGNGGSGALVAAGYGNSDKPFSDPAWHLPAGVELADSIHDYSYCWAFPPYTQVQAKDWKGVPVGFTFCITLHNTNNGPVIIQFPPELAFVSSSVEHQNVLIIDMGSIQMEPGATQTIVAQGFCLNEGRTPPSTYIDGTENYLTYSFGPSEIPAALKEIAGIIESKHINMSELVNANGAMDNAKTAKYAVIQQAIWEVTDNNGLTESTRVKLKAL